MYVIWIMLAFLLLYLAMAIKGPSVWDRLLGMELTSAKIILLIVLFASLRDTSYFLDYAFIYVLFSFMGTIFITLFWSRRQKQRRDK